LIETVGFYEYFNPAPNQQVGKQDIGLGGHNFSWTSAIYLDFKNNTVIL
jgi:hypothetical protein